jgi:hypothetical protein
MNSINKTAGMAGFLYVIYLIIHLSAGASQQKTAGVAGADQALNYSRPVFQGDARVKEMQMNVMSPEQNKIQQRRN